MPTRLCDRCGQLIEEGALRYIAKIQVYAAYDPLNVDFEDLYGLAGYESPERLPSFRPYLRAKYELPPEAVADLERYFELLRNYYGIPKDQPVYPPKKAIKPKGDPTQRRAA